MDDLGPSSVTIEEAVAKLIGFDFVPENITLIDALEYMVDATEHDFFDAKENQLDKKIVNRFEEELGLWNHTLSQAKEYLAHIERSIEENDHRLKTTPSDTCRVRLTTQSIYLWAKHHYHIDLPKWKEYRGSPKVPTTKIDKEELERRHLFLAIAWLTDEILTRDWSGWKGNTPILSPPKSHRYFTNERPNVSRLSKDIHSKLGSSNQATAQDRTYRKHINQAIFELTEKPKKGSTFTSGEALFAYKALVGLYRLLEPDPQSISKNGAFDKDTIELGLSRFTNGLESMSEHIHNRELVGCLYRALTLASDKDF